MFRTFFMGCLLGALAMLQGCSSGPSLAGQPYYQGPAEASGDSATLYFFREEHEVGSAVSQNIFIDEKLVGALPNGGYFKTQVAAGTRSVVASRGSFLQGDLGDGKFNLVLESGKTYFIANETSRRPYEDDQGLTEVQEGTFRQFEHYYFRWASVPQGEAEKRMKACRLVPAVRH